MKVFDTNSNRDKSWSGTGFTVRDNNLILHQSSNIKHSLTLENGKYTLKFLARKRSGAGMLNLNIIDSKNGNILLNKTLNLTKSSWTENIFNFEINSDSSIFFISLFRNQSSFGSVEIGRIVVERDVKIALIERIEKKKQDVEISKPIVFNKPSFNLKLAFVVPYNIYGGAEVYIKNIIENLDQNSFQINILYLNKNELSNYLMQGNVYHKNIPTLKHLESNIIANNYDVVIYYNSLSVYKSLSSLAKRDLIKSSLMEIYHSDFSWSDSISNLKERENIEKLFVVNDSLGNDISGLKPAAKMTIPVGIDISKYFLPKNLDIRGQLGISLEDKIIGTVARLSKEKNIQYILELSRLLPDFYFVVVGDGPEKSVLKNIIEHEKLKVNLVGFQRNVGEYLSNFNAFVLPSKMEGTPISILEAMAAEVPVFTSKVGAIPNIITHGENGFFLSINSKDDAKLIKEQIDNHDVVLRAKKYVMDHHDIKITSKKFADSLVTVSNFYEKINAEEHLLKIPGEYV